MRYYVVIYNCQEGIHPSETDRHQGAKGKRIGEWWKVNPKNFLKLLRNHLTRLAQCAIISVQIEGSPKSGGQEKNSKKFEKPLDKPQVL